MARLVTRTFIEADSPFELLSGHLIKLNDPPNQVKQLAEVVSIAIDLETEKREFMRQRKFSRAAELFSSLTGGGFGLAMMLQYVDQQLPYRMDLNDD